MTHVLKQMVTVHVKNIDPLQEASLQQLAHVATDVQ